ncbi:Salivary gland secretion 1 [Rhodotorula toruloides]|nr:Salivary gland secretion 1 [Rhodotorula toruloides]
MIWYPSRLDVPAPATSTRPDANNYNPNTLMATSDSLACASGSPEAPVKEPAASRAPDELWFLILDELDYIGLHRMAGVPKRLARLVKDTRFDDRLFRTKAPKRLKPGTMVAIHPLLHETVCIFADKKPVTYADIERDSERTAFDYPAAEEFATHPACSVMLVHLNTSKALPVTDRNGVKVKRLLQRLSCYWNAKPPLDIRYTVASQLEMDPDKVGWIDTLGDHCGWTGWEFGKVEDDGSVHLHANWYDS